MSTGYIKLHRKLLDNPLMSRPAYLSVWVFILLSANHEGKDFIWNGEKMHCPRGSFVTGRHKIAKSCGVSPSSAERALVFLEKEGQIGQQKTNKFRLISVKNWSKYQVSGQQKDNRRTTEGQQKDTNKNDKNDKNDKKVILHSGQSPQRKGHSPTDPIGKLFDIFYQSVNKQINWGNKTNRKAAEFLIKQMGVEKALEATRVACSVQGRDYAPVITTPYQLKEKLAQLMIYLKKHSTSKIAKI